MSKFHRVGVLTEEDMKKLDKSRLKKSYEPEKPMTFWEFVAQQLEKERIEDEEKAKANRQTDI